MTQIVMSDLDLHCLHSECSIKILIKMEYYTEGNSIWLEWVEYNSYRLLNKIWDTLDRAFSGIVSYFPSKYML